MSKKYFFLVMVLLAFQSVNAQIDVAGGMGISFVYNSSLNNYIEYNWAVEEVQPFNSTVEFYGEVDYSITEKYQLGFEYVYSLFDFNSSYIGNYNLSYSHHKPSLLVYYVISGEGYKFKFGGGAGLRIVKLTENILVDENFEALGVGLLLRAQGHTKLGDNFYANIGSTIRFDVPGEPSNNGDKLRDNTINENVNINSFSASVDIGISYFF